MNMNRESHVNGVVPPRIGRDNGDPKGLRVFRRLYDGHANDVREMGGSSAGNTLI